ncbi:MAG: transposase [Sphingomicrobium sp.]
MVRPDYCAVDHLQTGVATPAVFSRRQRGTPRQGLDRSKGGFTTKIHLRINAMGLPIAFALTGGEVSDFKGYLPVMNAEGSAPKVLFADKAMMLTSFAEIWKGAVASQ